MKRDMELIRTLLLEIEYKDDNDPVTFKPDDSGKYSKESIEYNLKLMIEHGFIEGSIDSYYDGKSHINVRRLTWSGHDFLDAARNDTVWNKAKSIAKEKGQELNELSISVLKALLVESSKKILGL